jgi:hypothetical protein
VPGQSYSIKEKQAVANIDEAGRRRRGIIGGVMLVLAVVQAVVTVLLAQSRWWRVLCWLLFAAGFATLLQV